MIDGSDIDRCRPLFVFAAIAGLVAWTGCIQNPESFQVDPTDAEADGGFGGDIDYAPQCEAPLTLCGNPLDGSARCVDTDRDAAHCGECDNSCTTDVEGHLGVCDNGVCVERCNVATGFAECDVGGECTDLNSNPEHCGTCGRSCRTGECHNGQCVPFECESGADPFGGGSGTFEDPYRLCNRTHWENLATHHEPGAHYVLGGDIDLSGWADYGVDEAPMISGFQGTLDGFGFAIRGFTIESARAPAGLFAVVDGDGEITNLSVEDYLVRGVEGGDPDVSSDRLGGLVGFNRGVLSDIEFHDGEVEGLTRVGGLIGENVGQLHGVTGDATAAGTSFEIGGLVGRNSGQISDVDISTEVVAGEEVDESAPHPRAVGGVAGTNLWNSRIVDVIVDTEISAVGEGDDGAYSGRIGGIAGHNYGLVQRCRAVVDITSTEYGTGGVVGRFDIRGELRRCGVTGSITAPGDAETAAPDDAGGLVGLLDRLDPSGAPSVDADDEEIHETVQVAESYAAVDIEAGEFAGGLIGRVELESATVADSYATGDVDAPDVAGGLVGELAGEIYRSYAVGHVASVGDDTGGLVGRVTDSDSQRVYDSYWHQQRTDQPESPGGGQPLAEDEDFESGENFTSWDFYDVWTMPFGDQLTGTDDFVRPRFQWEFDE